MEVTVVGSGPAGLMAADVLSEAGAKVTILDHHKSPARKFLLAGRGGLNLTNNEPVDELLKRYGKGSDWLAPAIRAFPPTAMRSWCEGLGIETFIGSSGRIFPVGMKASPVLRAWLRRLQSRGVLLRSGAPWQGFDDTPTILAMGGASWPELGSDAGWVKIFEARGIAVSKMLPANCRQPVQWSGWFAQSHAGHPIKNIAASCGSRHARGEMMISSAGIEGGAIYAVAGGLREPGVRAITIDLKPDLTEAEVEHRMSRPQGKQTRSNHLRKLFNLTPAAISLMKETGAASPKSVRIAVQGEADIRRAISTSGGVTREELTPHFKLHKVLNCWAVGEMLDWDAPTGGYLLQACFATARWAALDVLKNR